MNFAQTGIMMSSVGGVVYDADYDAILKRSTFLGYTNPVTEAQRQKENTAMIAIKAVFGVANIADAPILQGLMFATDGDSDYATISWRDPTNATRQATKINSPTFTPGLGFNGNGSTSYLLAGYFIADVTQSNVSYAGRGFVNNATGSRTLWGVAETGITGSAVFINPRNTSNQVTMNAHDGTNIVVESSITDATHRYITARNSGTKYYSRNGSAFSSFSQALITQTTNREMALLAMNGNTIQFFSGSGISYHWCFSRKLTDQEAADFDAVMVNYLSP